MLYRFLTTYMSYITITSTVYIIKYALRVIPLNSINEYSYSKIIVGWFLKQSPKINKNIISNSGI